MGMNAFASTVFAAVTWCLVQLVSLQSTRTAKAHCISCIAAINLGHTLPPTFLTCIYSQLWILYIAPS